MRATFASIEYLDLVFSLSVLIILGSSTLVVGQDRARIRGLFTDSTKSGYKANIRIGNPTNKDIELELNDYAYDQYRYDLQYSDGWFNFKKRLNENHGLQLSINYSSIFLGATSKISEGYTKTAASGILDITIKWNFVNHKADQNVGSLVFWVDSRHLYYGDVTPQFLFQEVGSATLSATKFNKWSMHVLEFYYQQALFDNRMGFVIGKIDMPDWFNFNALGHPNLHFTDLTMLFNPTISVSNPGMGIGLGGWLDKKKRFGLVLGFNDVAGVDLKDPGFLDFGTDQWGNGKFLKMVEMAYTPSRAKYYDNRVSATFWHSDELLESDQSFFQTPSSKGFTVQASWTINDKYIPVFTFGLSDGKGANALSKLNISLMNAWDLASHDMLGIGLNYTKSSITDENQFLSEIFYRWTWSKTMHLTPLVKFVINPALNPDRDFLMYYGIRSRISI